MKTPKAGEFEATLREHYPSIYSYLLAKGGGDIHSAENATQETFVAACRHKKKFCGSRSMVPWLKSVGKNKLMDEFRAAKRFGTPTDFSCDLESESTAR